jgi:hypothetical protein
VQAIRNSATLPQPRKAPLACFGQAGWLNEDSHAYGFISSASIRDLEALCPENIPFLHLQPRLKERFRHEQREDGSYLISQEITPPIDP